MGTEEENREVAHVVSKALDVWWHKAGVADLSWPPSNDERDGGCKRGKKVTIAYRICSVLSNYFTFKTFKIGPYNKVDHFTQ